MYCSYFNIATLHKSRFNFSTKTNISAKNIKNIYTIINIFIYLYIYSILAWVVFCGQHSNRVMYVFCTSHNLNLTCSFFSLLCIKILSFRWYWLMKCTMNDNLCFKIKLNICEKAAHVMMMIKYVSKFLRISTRQLFSNYSFLQKNAGWHCFFFNQCVHIWTILCVAFG